MVTGSYDDLVKVRKTRVDNALRDMGALQNEKAQVEQHLQGAKQKFQNLLQAYAQAQGGLQSNVGRSMAEFAAINGDILAVKDMIYACQQEVAKIEEYMAALDKRIEQAKARWRELERAHDRFNELLDEIKKQDIMDAMIAEEYAES